MSIPKRIPVSPRRLCLSLAATLLSASGAGCGAGESDDWEEFRVPIFADAYVYNAGEVGLVLEIEHLAPEAIPDCEVLVAEPTSLLEPGLLAPAQLHDLPPGATLGLRDMAIEKPCYAAIVTPLDEASQVVVWWAGSLPNAWVDGEILDPQDLRAGAVSLDHLGGVTHYHPQGQVSVITLDDQ
ncbi:MAG: hypothetical protein ACPG77_15640 [Nannocystaceae bacterium]